MTEAEWLACDDREGLQNFLLHHPSAPRYPNLERRLRLYTCGCCRLIWDRFHADVCRHAVVVGEAYADAEIGAAELAEPHAAINSAPVPVGAGSREEVGPFGRASVPTGPEWEAVMAAYYVTLDPGQRYPAGETLGTSAGALHGPACVIRAAADLGTGADAGRAVMAIFRDIFGNPFRPVAFDPGWRSDTVVALARGMYDARDFGPMPVLADALDDAGCDAAELLAHCRDPHAVHVRGCWAVDLVLGKV